MSDSYRDLVAWQRAMELVTRVYRDTESFPSREMYGLTTQLRKAAVAVPSDIAEGKGRRTKRDYVGFLYRARGSLHEVETQLEIAKNLAYLPTQTYEELQKCAAGVARPLNGLVDSIEAQLAAESRQPRAESHEQ